jgi:hypothetical protein
VTSQPLTKLQFRRALGKDSSDADVARFFGISAAAVCQWPDDRPIPELRWLKAIQKRPDLFGDGARDPARQDDSEAA